MKSQIQKIKQDYGKFWQYEENKKELSQLLEKVRCLRIKIKKFEEEQK